MQVRTTYWTVAQLGGLVLAGLVAACNNTPTNDPNTPDLAMPGGSDVDLAGGGGGDSGKPLFSFFITSRTGSGDLGGLAGADTTCKNLAAAAGGGGRTWAAYLSATGVNAKDRIGQGPWYNKNGVKVADSVADLHSANVQINKANGLTEAGQTVNGFGDTPNQHDILTGSTAAGMADTTTRCADWTSGTAGTANVGHHDRMGGGSNLWNFAHASNGCSLAQLQGSGGAGRFYCFATD